MGNEQAVRNRPCEMETPNGVVSVSPEDSAGWLSKATWHWLTPLLFLGYRRPLENGDVFALPETYRAEALADSFERAWKAELEKWIRSDLVDGSGQRRVKWTPRNPDRPPAFFFGLIKHSEPSVLAACSTIFWKQFAAAGAMRFVSDATQVVNPILLNFLINYIVTVGTGAYSLGYGLGFAFAIFGMAIINAFAMHGNW